MPYTPPTTDVQKDPNYIGATNFSKIQTQFTPYQIDKATVRNTNGDIFWNPDVNISSIPKAQPSQPDISQPAPSSAMSSVTSSIQYPDIPTKTDFTARNDAAAKYMTGLGKSIDDLRAQQEATDAAAANQQTGVVQGLKDKFTSLLGKNPSADARSSAMQEYGIKDQLNSLSVIRQRIADAQDAMNQGVIYEESRPVRQSLLQGRSLELQKQGNAKIASLQATAEIIKGNLDLANTYVNNAVSDAKDDNASQKDALQTLLSLEDKKLTTLTEDEKSTIKDRMAALDTRAAQIETDKTANLTLAQTYPDAFAKSGALFTDTPEEVTAKMMPFLKQYEQLNLQKLQADIAATNRSNKGGGAGSGSGKLLSSFDSNMQALIDAAFKEGVSLDKFIADVGGPTQFTPNQLNTLQDFWTTYQKKSPTVTATTLKNSFGIDPAKHPEYIGLTEDELQQKLTQANADQLVTDANKPTWYNPFTWFGTGNK